MNRISLVVMAALLAAVAILSGCNAVEPVDNLTVLEEINQRFQEGQYEPANQECRDYVAKFPKSSAGWTLYGWTYLELDAYDKAEECFKKALQIDSKHDNALVGLGAMYRRQGEYQAARESYLKALEIVPDNAEAFSSLLGVELMEGNDRKAVEYGEKAWALRQDMAVIASNLSLAYHCVGDTAKRDRFFKEAERLKYPQLENLREIFAGTREFRPGKPAAK
jgi:tetratricopeptide (TPR) repeat protein